MALVLHIEAIERLIEEENVGLLGKGSGNKRSLLLPSRELVNLAVRNGTEIHRFDRLICFFLIDLPEATEVAKVGEASHCHHIADPDGEMSLVLVDLGR